MIFKYIHILLLVICVSTTVNAGDEPEKPAKPANFAEFADTFSIITEIYPPYNFLEKEKLQGISVDLMVLMLGKVNSKQTREDIKLWPWARGYRDVLEKRNTCLFSTTRTKKREDLFKWVGPISPTTISIFAKKKRNIKINKIDDLRKYKIGVVIDDIGEQLLVTAGIALNNLERMGGVHVIRSSLKKLNRERIDLFSYEENAVKWVMKTKDFNPEDYEIVYTLKRGEVYYVFHKETPDSYILKLQTALDELKSGGEYDNVLRQYLH